jgi:repressor LexA
MNNQPLTEKQQAILTFIETATERHGRPPTVREIADHFGYRSPRAVSDHLDALERKGALQRQPGTARGLVVIAAADPTSPAPPRDAGIPIVGDVAAGLPILAEQHVQGCLRFDEAFGNGPLFAVRVRGDSMIDEGIHEGDHVIVRRAPVLEQEAIAVVYLNGEATVKRVRRTSRGFSLIPGNPRYAVTEVTCEQQDFAIAGPVVGVVRSLRSPNV